MSHSFRPGCHVQVAGIPGVHTFASEGIETMTITLGSPHGNKFIGECVTVEKARVRPLPLVFTERPDGAA